MTSDAFHEIVGLERALLDPDTRHNAEWLDGVFEDGMIEFGKSGRSSTRDEIIQALVAEPPSPVVQFQLVAPKLTLLSADVALLTYRLEPLVESLDGDPLVASLRSSIWRFADGRWRMLFHQGTTAG